MNVIFESIKINNFLSLGENIDIDLNDKGFVLVKGINQESNKSKSNGAGKSSIFDAIFWTITGETLRGTSDVVNEKSNCGCYCSLKFSVDSDSYEIVRYKSHPDYGNTTYFYVNDLIVSDQTKKSQEMINKTIPVMSSEILGSIVLLGQGLPYKFSSLSPIRRKDLLETLSGSSSQIEKLKYQLDVVESEYVSQDTEIKSKVNQCRGALDGNERILEFLTESRKISSEEIVSQINNYISNRVKMTEDLEKLKEQLKLEEVKYNDLRKVYDSLGQFITKTSVELDQVKNEINSYGSGICPTCNRPYDNYEELQKLLRDSTARYNNVEVTLNSLNAKMVGVRSQLDRQMMICQDIRNQCNSIEGRIQIESQESDNCTKALEESKEVDTKISNSENEIKSLRVQLYDLNKEQEVVSNYLTTVQFLKRQVSRDFKGYVLEEVIKFLSMRAESYGNYLFDSRKIKVSLSGNKILIYIGDRLYENLSGGERQRIDLCVQFALRDMLMTTTGFSCNLLVLDEAFDNLDSQGSDNLISLVTTEFSDVNSVFTVTHHTDISIPYDSMITVTKNSNGISEVGEY